MLNSQQNEATAACSISANANTLPSMNAYQLTELLDNRNVKNLIQSGRVYALTAPNNWVDVTQWEKKRIIEWLDQRD